MSVMSRMFAAFMIDAVDVLATTAESAAAAAAAAAVHISPNTGPRKGGTKVEIWGHGLGASQASVQLLIDGIPYTPPIDEHTTGTLHNLEVILPQILLKAQTSPGDGTMRIQPSIKHPTDAAIFRYDQVQFNERYLKRWGTRFEGTAQGEFTARHLTACTARFEGVEIGWRGNWLGALPCASLGDI